MTYFKSATYSPEDNKIRLYPLERLPEDLYLKLKENGFRWAREQELFFASWRYYRVLLVNDLYGPLEREEMTLHERAEIRANRFDGYAEKRFQEANQFAKAAQEFSLDLSQPILTGHHSARKQEKAEQKKDVAEKNANERLSTANYWLYRAEGVEYYANMKSNPRVIAGRIKTLLKDLRSYQRTINHAKSMRKFWLNLGTNGTKDPSKFQATVEYYAGAYFKNGHALPIRSGYDEVKEAIQNGISDDDLKTMILAYSEQWDELANGPAKAANIVHILNRLSFEQSRLDEVEIFTGKLTPAILQTFARAHGAQKPKATKTEDGYFELTSSIDLPAHIAKGPSKALLPEEWCELMQSLGYEVPAPKPKKPSILNFKAESGLIDVMRHRKIETFRQIELTKAEYSEIYSDYRGVALSACGTFRVKFCIDPHHTGPRYMADYVAVYLTDSKDHGAPDSLREAA